MRNWAIILLCIWTSIVESAQTSNANFALSEHLAAGQKIALQFDINSLAEVNPTLTLPNGLKLTFGNILSLGDLCGVVGQPITLGETVEEQQKRFLNAFNSFAKNMNSVDEIRQLNQVIGQELEMIRKGMQQGEPPETIYQRIGNEVGRQINCITGGGCHTSFWWMFPGRYLKLAMENYDHFVPNAKMAYLSGHQVALNQALKARDSGLKEDLELAYAMDAFACHFLSDLFAAGHIRTPRVQLANHVSPSLLGSLLANYMHNEENINGLHVHNRNYEHWAVYGDFSYFNPHNLVNKQMLERLLQQSANAVFNTYYSGESQDPSPILAQIPEHTEDSLENNFDITPLFYWDEQSQKLLRRQDIGNPYDSNMTADWWGWSTLLDLKRHYGETTEMRSILHVLGMEHQEKLKDFN